MEEKRDIHLEYRNSKLTRESSMWCLLNSSRQSTSEILSDGDV